MEILDRTEDKVAILCVNGDIVAQTIAELKPHLERHIDNKEVEGLILDCEEVGHIDSAGLDLLVSAFKSLQKANKRFALSQVGERVRETFSLTSLDRLFTISKEITSAVKAVQ